MKKLKRHLILNAFTPVALLFFFTLALSSCAVFDTFSVSKVKPTEFASFIDKYEDEMKTAADKDIRARLQLRLAELLSCHANPKPDYKKAYIYLTSYAESIKPEAPSHELLDKLTMLRLIIKANEVNAELSDSIKKLEGIDKKIEEMKNK